MKKLAGLVATIALMAGLTMFVSGPSQAAGGVSPAALSCPAANRYTGCVKTTSKITLPKKAPKATKKGVQVKISATVRAGKTHPVGTYVIKVKLKKKVVWTSKRLSTAKKLTVSAKTKKLKKGTYTVTVTFTPAAKTPYTASSATKKLTIKKK